MTLSRQHTKWRGEKALCGSYDAIAFLLCQGHVLHENTVRARQSKDSTTLCRLVNKSQFSGMIQHLNVPPRMLDLQFYSPLLPIARLHTWPCINVDQPICRLPLSDPFRRWKHFGRCTSGSFQKSHPKFNVLVVIQPLLSPSSHYSPFPLIVQLQNQQSLTLPIWTAGRLFQDGDGVHCAWPQTGWPRRRIQLLKAISYHIFTITVIEWRIRSVQKHINIYHIDMSSMLFLFRLTQYFIMNSSNFAVH